VPKGPEANTSDTATKKTMINPNSEDRPSLHKTADFYAMKEAQSGAQDVRRRKAREEKLRLKRQLLVKVEDARVFH